VTLKIRKYSTNEFDDTSSISVLIIQHLTRNNRDYITYNDVNFLLILSNIIGANTNKRAMNRMEFLKGKPSKELEILVENYLRPVKTKCVDAIRFLVSQGHLIQQLKLLPNIQGNNVHQHAFYLSANLKSLKELNTINNER